LQELNSTPKLLLAKCYGLSLSDQYWVKPINSDLEWELVKQPSEVLSGEFKLIFSESFAFPNRISPTSSEKSLSKKLINQKRCLLKAGSLPYEQQPFNEAIASLIMKKLNVCNS